MGLLYYLSYAAILASFAFVTLSLASGLLYVSELIEEHSTLAKTVGQRAIYAIICLHAVLYFTESLPLLQTIFSIGCHIVYLQNFSSSWPLISLTSLSFIGSCVLVIIDHFMWFFHFAHRTQEARHRAYRSDGPEAPGFSEIATFFAVCVWFMPLFLFLSLSANDHALPTLSSAQPGSPTSKKPPASVPLFRSILAMFDFSVPRLRPKPTRRGTTDGLIAPRTPLLQPPPSSRPSSRPSSPALPLSPPPPPRSPRPQDGFPTRTPPIRSSSAFRVATEQSQLAARKGSQQSE